MRRHNLAILAMCLAAALNVGATDEGVVTQAKESPDEDASAAIFTVSGEVSYKKTGPIDVRLCTEDEFPGVGECTWGARLDPGSSPGKVSFELRGVPAGKYGLRAFQDKNENGKLDVGMFGPKEPWALHRPARPKFRAPKFKDVVFELEGDLELTLEVR